MTRMIRTLLGLAVVGLITACASPDPMTNGPTMQGKPDAAGGMSMAAMEPRMQAMQAMHAKMMAARTPAERQALMADHMKAMQDGMAMMKEKHAMPGTGGMGGMAGKTGMAGMADAACKPGEMAAQHRMTGDHHAMMQMMMDMMGDRMPAAPAAR